LDVDMWAWHYRRGGAYKHVSLVITLQHNKLKRMHARINCSLTVKCTLAYIYIYIYIYNMHLENMVDIRINAV